MFQKIISNKESNPYFYSFSRRIRLIFSLFLSFFFLFKFGYCKACQRAMEHKRLKAGSRIQRENETGYRLVYRHRGRGEFQKVSPVVPGSFQTFIYLPIGRLAGLYLFSRSLDQFSWQLIAVVSAPKAEDGGFDTKIRSDGLLRSINFVQ